jgi:hypothetical protein
MLSCESFNGKVDGNEVMVPFVSTAFFSDIKLLFQVPILPRQRFGRHVFAARYKRDYEGYVRHGGRALLRFDAKCSGCVCGVRLLGIVHEHPLAVVVKAPEIAREIGRGACDALPEVPE